MSINPEALETLAGMGADEADAARALSISLTDFRQLLASPEHRDAWKAGETKANIAVATALYAAACAGNVQAQIFWLSNRQPKLWAKVKGKSKAGGDEKPLQGLRIKKA